MKVTKKTEVTYEVPELGMYLSEVEARALHTALSEALGLTTYSTREYTDPDGDIWAVQTNGTWGVRERADGSLNSYFNDPDEVDYGVTIENLETTYPGGTWR